MGSGGAVTEAQWQAARGPELMLQFLRDKVSERKLRLFGCACVRRVWGMLTEGASRAAVEVAEQFADGTARAAELADAFASAANTAADIDWGTPRYPAGDLAPFARASAAYAACDAARPDP